METFYCLLVIWSYLRYLFEVLNLSIPYSSNCNYWSLILISFEDYNKIGQMLIFKRETVVWTDSYMNGNLQSEMWLNYIDLPYFFNQQISDRFMLPCYVAKWLLSFKVGKYFELGCGFTKCMYLYIWIYVLLFGLLRFSDLSTELSFILLMLVLVFISKGYKSKVVHCHSFCDGIIVSVLYVFLGMFIFRMGTLSSHIWFLVRYIMKLSGHVLWI